MGGNFFSLFLKKGGGGGGECKSQYLYLFIYLFIGMKRIEVSLVFYPLIKMQFSVDKTVFQLVFHVILG